MDAADTNADLIKPAALCRLEGKGIEVLIERRVAREFPQYRVFDPCRNGVPRCCFCPWQCISTATSGCMLDHAFVQSADVTLPSVQCEGHQPAVQDLHCSANCHMVGAALCCPSSCVAVVVLSTNKLNAVAADADFCITLGGDGTVLHLTSLFVADEPLPPVVAFAMGTLGMLHWLLSFVHVPSIQGTCNRRQE